MTRFICGSGPDSARGDGDAMTQGRRLSTGRRAAITRSRRSRSCRMRDVGKAAAAKGQQPPPLRGADLDQQPAAELRAAGACGKRAIDGKPSAPSVSAMGFVVADLGRKARHFPLPRYRSGLETIRNRPGAVSSRPAGNRHGRQGRTPAFSCATARAAAEYRCRDPVAAGRSASSVSRMQPVRCRCRGRVRNCRQAPLQQGFPSRVSGPACRR